MPGHAAPEPAEGMAPEHDSRPMGSDAGASGSSSETVERGRAGSAASFRALTERLRSRTAPPVVDVPTPDAVLESPARAETPLSVEASEAEEAQAFLDLFADAPAMAPEERNEAPTPQVEDGPAETLEEPKIHAPFEQIAAAPPDGSTGSGSPPPEAVGNVAPQDETDPIPVPEDSKDPRSAEIARALLDIMSMPSGASQPQERALAADTLLRLADLMPLDGLILLSERLSIMDSPPPLLVRRLLASSSPEVAAPLLEKCNSIADQDLIELSSSMDAGKLRMVARRRHVSSALSDVLIQHADPSLDLTLIRNPNAVLSHEAFSTLGERAKTSVGLQAPLATRADTPVPIAFELFWHHPAELRRYVLSRFLTDSSTLERILSIARTATHPAPDVRALRQFPDRESLADLVRSIERGETEAAGVLATLAGVCETNARRIIADPGGEPLMVAMKALGMPRADFAEAIARWRASPAAALSPDRDLDDLQALFDTLSFNKARVLLTYWDWGVLQSGPYQRRRPEARRTSSNPTFISGRISNLR